MEAQPQDSGTSTNAAAVHRRIDALQATLDEVQAELERLRARVGPAPARRPGRAPVLDLPADEEEQGAKRGLMERLLQENLALRERPEA